jgi:hypothetical protein
MRTYMVLVPILWPPVPLKPQSETAAEKKPSVRIEALRREMIAEARRKGGGESNPERLKWLVLALIKYLDEEYDNTEAKQ